MKLNVSQVRGTENGLQRYRFVEDFSGLQPAIGEYVFLLPLTVDLEIVNAGKSLLVKGRISSEVGVGCSRCLKTFSYPLDFEFQDEWFPQEFASAEEEGNALIFEKDEFSIDDRILEHILLQMPMKFICSADCPGLCPSCGKDLNMGECDCAGEKIDPRLQILSEWNKGV